MTKISSKIAVPGYAFVGSTNFSRVQAAFERGPIQMQRNHSKRALHASHIGESLSGTQLTFHLVMWGGVERLIDGYTRCECITTGLTKAPSRVVVLVHEDPMSEAKLAALYDQFDSRSALKKASDRFEEGLRLSGLLDKLSSQLVLSAQKTAPKIATNASDVRKGVLEAAAGMQFVDRIGLKKNHETLGVAAAYYAIGLFGKKFPMQAEAFIRNMNACVFEPETPTLGDKAIIGAREFHFDKQRKQTATGGSNVVAIRDNVLGAFVVYVGASLSTVSEQRVSLGEFNEILKKFELAA